MMNVDHKHAWQSGTDNTSGTGSIQWSVEHRSWSPALLAGLTWPERPLLVAAPLALLPVLPDSTLAPGERRRAERFRVAADRDRYRLAHELKRRILGQILHRSPRTLRFGYSRHGRPFLHDNTLHFNLSHSGDWILLGVFAGGALGVDLEAASPEAFQPVARWLLHPDEYREWVADGYPGSSLQRSWVLKEALAKATGAGVALPFYTLRLYPRGDHFQCWCQQKTWLLARRQLDDDHGLALATDADIREVRLVVLTAGQS